MTEPIAYLAIPAKDLKSLRETLCRAQTLIYQQDCYARNPVRRLQMLCDEIDRHRPLGSNGKHGNLHTPTCGCETDDD